MAKLSFIYDYPSFVSDSFTGNVRVECSFPKEALNKVTIETRLDENSAWRILRSVIIGIKNAFTLDNTASGQQYRLRCATRPTDAEYAVLSPSGGGGSGSIDGIDVEENQDGQVNTLKEVMNAFGGFPEDKTIQEALEDIEGGGLTEEDLEEIFSPSSEAGNTQDNNQESSQEETSGETNENTSEQTPSE